MTKLFYRPIDPWFVRQTFGANQVCTDIATGTKYVSCDGHNPPPGYRSVYGPHGHKGLDLRASLWQPVYAAREGVVLRAEYIPSFGNFVELRHDFGPLGRWKTRYCHFVAIDVDPRQKVSTGQLIGYAGTTGISTAVHLHLEIESPAGVEVDPAAYLFEDTAVSVNKLRLSIEKLAAVLQRVIDRMRTVQTSA